MRALGAAFLCVSFQDGLAVGEEVAARTRRSAGTIASTAAAATPEGGAFLLPDDGSLTALVSPGRALGDTTGDWATGDVAPEAVDVLRGSQDSGSQPAVADQIAELEDRLRRELVAKETGAAVGMEGSAGFLAQKPFALPRLGLPVDAAAVAAGSAAVPCPEKIALSAAAALANAGLQASRPEGQPVGKNIFVPGLGSLQAQAGVQGLVSGKVNAGANQVAPVDSTVEAGCPPGTLPVSSALECQQASDKLFQMGSLSVTEIASALDPPGCWLYGCGNKMQALIYNCQGTVDFRRPSRNLICMGQGVDFSPVLDRAQGCESDAPAALDPAKPSQPIVVNVHLHVGSGNGGNNISVLDLPASGEVPTPASAPSPVAVPSAPKKTVGLVEAPKTLQDDSLPPLDNGTPANMVFEMGQNAGTSSTPNTIIVLMMFSAAIGTLTR